jgi:hypothetical protein
MRIASSRAIFSTPVVGGERMKRQCFGFRGFTRDYYTFESTEKTTIEE